MDRFPHLNKTDLESITTNNTGNPSLEEDPEAINIGEQDPLHHSISSENLLEENFLLGSDLDLNESLSSVESEIFSRLAEEENDGTFWLDSDESELLREEEIEGDGSDILNLEAVPIDFESSLLLSEDSDTEDLEMSKLIDGKNSPTIAMDSQALESILMENSETEGNLGDCGPSGAGYDISAEEEDRLLAIDVPSSVREEARVQSAAPSGASPLRDDCTKVIDVETRAQVHVHRKQIVARPSEIRRSFSDVQLATCSHVSSSYKRKADKNQELDVEEDSSDDELLFPLVGQALPRPKRRRVINYDDMFIKMLTPCDELRFMARDLHFKWISIDEAERKMRDIFERARTKMEFWRTRNVDCSRRALIQTCAEESILQLVYTSMSLSANEPGTTRNTVEYTEPTINCSSSSADQNQTRQFVPTNLANNTSESL